MFFFGGRGLSCLSACWFICFVLPFLLSLSIVCHCSYFPFRLESKMIRINFFSVPVTSKKMLNEMQRSKRGRAETKLLNIILVIRSRHHFNSVSSHACANLRKNARQFVAEHNQFYSICGFSSLCTLHEITLRTVRGNHLKNNDATELS